MNTLKIPYSDCPPDLVADDIPFTKYGFYRSIVVDHADAETYREMVSVLIEMVSQQTAQLRRRERIIIMQRDELRRRPDRAA